MSRAHGESTMEKQWACLRSNSKEEQVIITFRSSPGGQAHAEVRKYSRQMEQQV